MNTNINHIPKDTKDFLPGKYYAFTIIRKDPNAETHPDMFIGKFEKYGEDYFGFDFCYFIKLYCECSGEVIPQVICSSIISPQEVDDLWAEKKIEYIKTERFILNNL